MRSSYRLLQNGSLAFVAITLPVVLGLGAAVACSEKLPAPLATAETVARFDARPSNTTCLAGPLSIGRVRLEPTFEGFTNPMMMEDRPDRGLVYVGEVGGRVKIYDRKAKTVSVALDIAAGISKDHEAFVGFAVHPTKPYAYATVERDLDPATAGPNKNRAEIIRFTTADGGRTFDPASEKLVLRMDR
ncbi:MAG: Glutamate synthase large chain, partial [Myxococcaceae bacterium]|nr:Glutamate synthase large chain [Myxococcaceae bacterium]